MQKAIDLALLGQGQVAPNPLVGAVLVHEDRIIGQGYHAVYGGPHAEVNAFAAVAPEDQALVPASTLYVSLEPCSHQGKTPPCVALVLSKEVKKVVVAALDPFPAVNGKGIALLREAGVEVLTGVLEKEAQQINAPFFRFHATHQTLVTLKWAQSADGFMAATGKARTLISGPQAQSFVQQLRAQHMAILVGYRTALFDNPLLTNRSGKGKNPLRIVVDPQGKLPQDLNLFQGPQPAWRFQPQHPKWVPELLESLAEKGVQSLLVEGGRNTLDSFLTAGVADNIFCLRSQHLLLHSGLAAPALPSFAPQWQAVMGSDEVLAWSPHAQWQWPYPTPKPSHV